MKYLLHKDYRLRGWKGDPFYLEYFPDRSLRRLSLSEFSYLMKCDGQTEIEPDEWPGEPAWVREKDVTVPCEDGGQLQPGQEYHLYPNRKLDYIELSLTGRCNFNCKHCFNAKDCSPRTVEPSMEQLLALLERMDDCGVGKMRLNGGEPLMRRDLLEFTGEMSRRGIRMRELLTNGWLLTPELVDALEAQGHRPIWFVSFDGLGCHDWLRGVKGAEQRALSAIRMLCERGYYVHVHQCVWKDSLPSVKPTVLKLREMGVSRYRIVPVEPSLRWRELAPDQSVSIGEWLRYIPGFLDWWYESGVGMDLDLWSFWIHKHGEKRAYIVPDLASGGLSDDSPSCSTNRRRPFIDADGRVVPCMPLSGITSAYGIGWGNVYEGDDLQAIFTDSAFLEQAECSCRKIKENNPECQRCQWRPRCAVGCRAEALAQGHGINGVDERICRFFSDGCFEQLLGIAEKHGLKVQ